jgi:hypothetical protein
MICKYEALIEWYDIEELKGLGVKPVPVPISQT